jgi:inosine-uridine nucleoside N-ribohydrolase
MVPIDVTFLTSMNSLTLQKFKTLGTESEFGKFLWSMIDFRQNTSPELFIPFYSMFHDAVVLVYAIDSSIFTSKKVNVRVETSSALTYGSTSVDLNGQMTSMVGLPANVNVVTNINVEKYWVHVMDVIESLNTKSKNSGK